MKPSIRSVGSFFTFDTFFFLCVVIVVLFSYRFGIVDLPRADQFHFLQEQELSKTNLEFFLRVLSWNRSGLIAQGDFFLFRPGFFAYLGLVSIFFRENLYVSGALSLFLHAVTVFAFYQLIRKIVQRSLACVLAMVFCIQYAGMEMFLWRHISPYMLGLTLFIFGILMVTGENVEDAKKKQWWMGGLLLFGSTLFHESFALSLLLLSLIAQHCRKHKLFLVMLAVAMTWGALNIMDFFYHHPNTIFGDDSSSQHLNFLNTTRNLVFLSGLSVSAFFVPPLIQLNYEVPFLSRAFFDAAQIPAQPILAIGALFLVLLGLLARQQFNAAKTFKGKGFDIRLVVLIYFLVLLTGFGVGRVTVRTIEYLERATYYFYLFYFCLLFFFTVILGALSKRFVNQSRFTWVVVLIAIPYVAITFHKIQETLRPHSKSNELVAKTVWQLNKTFQAYPEYCYGGTLGKDFNQLISGDIILSQHCVKKKALPLYAIPTQYESILTLGAINRPKLPSKEIVLNSNEMVPEKNLILQLDSSYEPTGHEEGWLSRAAFSPLEISVDMKKLSSGGLIFAYQNPRNFVALYGYRAELFVVMNKFGISQSKWYEDKLIGSGEYVHLAVRSIANDYVAIFCNEKVIATFPQGDLLNGRIGLYTNESSPPSDVFKNLTVMEASSDESEQFFFAPVLEIPL